MVKTRAKGNRNQLKCIKALEKEGYRVAKVELGGKFTKEKDLFGLFDLVCIKKNSPVLFVQVTTNRPHKHSEYEIFAEQYYSYPTYIETEQWVWYDRKGWVKFQYQNGGDCIKRDERK